MGECSIRIAGWWYRFDDRTGDLVPDDRVEVVTPQEDDPGSAINGGTGIFVRTQELKR